MCGIQAFVGKKNKKVDLNKFKKLMLWNALGRGQEATGIFSKENGIIKDNDRCDIFLGRNEIKPDTLIIGHVRAATYGGNTKANAHPFTKGNITLVHNGTLTNPFAWARHHNIDSNNINVDSDVICHVLNKEQNFDVLGEINGAAALVMHDNNTPNKLYVYRNKDRDLFHGKTSYGMYISSIKASLESIGCIEIAEFPVGTLHTIENGEIKDTKEITSKPFETTYASSTTKSTNETKGTPKYYTGRWIYCDSSLLTNCEVGTSMTSGKFYKCVGVTDELVVDAWHNKSTRSYIYIMDNNDIKRKVDFFQFDNYVTCLEKDCYLLILNDLFTTETIDGKEEKKLVLGKDQIVLLLDEDEFENKLKIHDGESVWNVPKGSVRRLTYTEEFEPDILNKTQNLDLNYTKNKDKKVELPKNNKEEEDEDEEEEDANFIVDANMLINNDFQYIKERIAELIEFSDTITIYDIKKALRELEIHVDNCITEYTDIAGEQGVIFFEEDKQMVKNNYFD